jgi:peptide/nickel transport system permease protein
MLAFLARRLVNVVLTLVVVTMVTFAIFFMVPVLTGSDPALLYIGKTADAAALEGIRAKMGFDKPIFMQYWDFLRAIPFGRDYAAGTEVTHCPAPCLGVSFKNDLQVWPLLLKELPVTLTLALGAAFIWVVVGVGAGVISALRKGRFADRAVMVGALSGVSLPIYFTGGLTLLIFVSSLGWLPRASDFSLDTFAADPLHWFLGMLMPWTTLAFLFAATYARLVRANMLETLGEDYIRTARAKGLGERTVVGKHALRSGLTPIITVFGLDLGLLLGGALLTETTFNLHGLGWQAFDAIRKNDLPIILGVTLFAAAFVVVANLIVDVLYAAIDPRVRLS